MPVCRERLRPRHKDDVAKIAHVEAFQWRKPNSHNQMRRAEAGSYVFCGYNQGSRKIALLIKRFIYEGRFMVYLGDSKFYEIKLNKAFLV